MSVKLLLDTDIGSDIDDAIALAYLLSQPKCELLGITTVSGEAKKRAMLASVLCKVAKKDVPIFPGAEFPLLIEQRQKVAHQAEALVNWEHDIYFPNGEAVEFLRRTIRKYPGEITLLAIGPLTNIATLFTVDPEVPHLLKSLVLMAGVFSNNSISAELDWNVICDPHAAAIVYKAPVKIHRSIGLDVTLQVTMESKEVKERFKAKLLKPVLDFARFDNSDVITFHDPLAAVTIFDNEVCKFFRGNISVELNDGKIGTTYWLEDRKGLHEVALAVNKERFFKSYFSVFEN